MVEPPASLGGDLSQGGREFGVAGHFWMGAIVCWRV
jgi:hypothetical protein